MSDPMLRLKAIEKVYNAGQKGEVRVLREAGYTGEIRAVGDIVIDMLGHLKRCGFDAFAPEHPLNPADAQNAFDRWDNVYQATADGRQPIWAKRHPAGV